VKEERKKINFEQTEIEFKVLQRTIEESLKLEELMAQQTRALSSAAETGGLVGSI
jgi:hypothetical protein